VSLRRGGSGLLYEDSGITPEILSKLQCRRAHIDAYKSSKNYGSIVSEIYELFGSQRFFIMIIIILIIIIILVLGINNPG